MLNSIIERHSMITPLLSDTEIKVIRSATKLFLTQGFSKTTHRQIAEESGIGLGTITYHYKVKEDLLRVLVEELMDFHLDVIDDSEAKSKDSLFSYAIEIAVQIALCETDNKAYDLEPGQYYLDAVCRAQINGIVNGVSKTEFAPNDNIIREQIAAIMHRYAEYKGYDVSVGENTNILFYDDFDRISEYAIAAMRYACGSA